eukprot:GHVO01015705.1.p1 GENE.GHVO01015705.1~~GHVO01015705.1.p1  ORF type:complete len:167 (+),score=23.93 GHVO01015705.1:78-503(+)
MNENENSKTSKKGREGTNHGGTDDGDMKMVVVIRSDLGMGKGKIGAQCGHAFIGAYENALASRPDTVKEWERSGCAKVVLKVRSIEEFRAIKKHVKGEGVPHYAVCDAGRTQLEPGTVTALGIGPGHVSEIDTFTKQLQLL